MKRLFVAALLALTLGALASAASAQPVPGGSLVEMLGALRAQLDLNTSQQQQWDNAAALSAAARSAFRASLQDRRAAVQAELAKPEPDFASLAAATDAAKQQLSVLHEQARDAWLALYATFTPEQKAIARDAIKARIAQIRARRAARRGSPST
jgi:Spy/CpxP family protein refolding chaperone